MHPVLRNTLIGVPSWAVLCAAVVLPRGRRIAETLGGGGSSVLLVYSILFIGGMSILPIFLSLDRIPSERMRFAAQLIACLLLAIVVLVGIGLYTF